MRQSTFRFYNVLPEKKLIDTSWPKSLAIENNPSAETSHELCREKSAAALDEKTKKREN